MLCGTGSFKHLDDNTVAEDSPTPRRRRRHGGDRGSNPFAERGLDKFTTVRSDLESRRDKILRRVGSDSGLVLVRFVQCNGRWAPIVVKLPTEQQRLKDPRKVSKTSTAASPSSTQPAASFCILPDPAMASRRDGAAKNTAARGMVPATRRRTASFSRRRLPPPTCYWLAVMVLMLLSLAVFGRTFAICSTSIAWYLLPILTDQRTPIEKSMKVVSPSTRPHHEVLSSPQSHAKRNK